MREIHYKSSLYLLSNLADRDKNIWQGGYEQIDFIVDYSHLSSFAAYSPGSKSVSLSVILETDSEMVLFNHVSPSTMIQIRCRDVNDNVLYDNWVYLAGGAPSITLPTRYYTFSEDHDIAKIVSGTVSNYSLIKKIEFEVKIKYTSEGLPTYIQGGEQEDSTIRYYTQTYVFNVN